MSSVDWYTIVEQPLQEAVQPFASTFLILLVALSSMVFVAVRALRNTRRDIAVPLSELHSGVDKLAQGQLNYQIPLPRNPTDEIGALTTSFNSMATQLSETIESERQARHEAQETNRLKDLFLATMSHELRTPLNSIIGFLGLMLYSEQLDEDNTHMAERSIANAERLLNLINNILDLSRISVGRLEIIPVSMSPRSLARMIQSGMELQVKNKKLVFQIVVDPSLPDIIVHDEERIHQIITNLIGNALKFTVEGEIRLEIKRRDDRLVIEVTDTGIGIPPAKQQVIFDEFVQVDGGSTRRHSGAGLGLSVVKRLTVLMQGTVGLVSEIGKGSTFIVELPLNLKPTQHRASMTSL